MTLKVSCLLPTFTPEKIFPLHLEINYEKKFFATLLSYNRLIGYGVSKSMYH